MSEPKSEIEPKLLLVDDTYDFRIRIKKLLVEFTTLKEEEIAEAGDGKKALAALKNHLGIRDIICDLNMEKMNGIGVARDLIERERKRREEARKREGEVRTEEEGNDKWNPVWWASKWSKDFDKFLAEGKGFFKGGFYIKPSKPEEWEEEAEYNDDDVKDFYDREIRGFLNILRKHFDHILKDEYKEGQFEYKTKEHEMVLRSMIRAAVFYETDLHE